MVRRRSEHQAQPELNVARQILLAGALSEVRVGRRAIRLVELRVIECVQELAPELQSDALAELERLDRRQIPQVESLLLRAGELVRVSAQLIAAPAGTVVWSKTVQAPIRDLFQLQDELTRRQPSNPPVAGAPAPPLPRLAPALPPLPREPIGPAGSDTAYREAQAQLIQRMATLQRERQSRWQGVLGRLKGGGSGGEVK